MELKTVETRDARAKGGDVKLTVFLLWTEQVIPPGINGRLDSPHL